MLLTLKDDGLWQLERLAMDPKSLIPGDASSFPPAYRENEISEGLKKEVRLLRLGMYPYFSVSHY